MTKLYVPENYDFAPLLDAFGKYNYLAAHPKYKNNYDYQLTLLILNKKYYMSNESILLSENPSPFSPISVLNYEFYRPANPAPNHSGDPSRLSTPRPGTTLSVPTSLLSTLAGNPDIQCIAGRKGPYPLRQGPATGTDQLCRRRRHPAIFAGSVNSWQV